MDDNSERSVSEARAAHVDGLARRLKHTEPKVSDILTYGFKEAVIRMTIAEFMPVTERDNQ